MGECCGNGCQRGGCDFDLDMIIWVLIIIVIVTCATTNLTSTPLSKYQWQTAVLFRKHRCFAV